MTTLPPRSPVARYSPVPSNSTALIRSSARAQADDRVSAGTNIEVGEYQVSASAVARWPRWTGAAHRTRSPDTCAHALQPRRGAPSAGSSVESLSPKTCLKPQLAWDILAGNERPYLRGGWAVVSEESRAHAHAAARGASSRRFHLRCGPSVADVLQPCWDKVWAKPSETCGSHNGCSLLLFFRLWAPSERVV